MTKLEAKLEALLAPQVRSLGYELLDLEYHTGGGSLLRLFIEFPEGEDQRKISLQDCVAVDKGLDPVLESPELDALLPQGFTLEVSSPGVDRPLKKPQDFQRFTGKKAVVKTFRPLTEMEMGNKSYFENHRKQKNFSGRLQGIQGEAVVMESDQESYRIPLALITKAHLDGVAELADGAKNED